MRVSVRWYEGTGRQAGVESTTLEEIESRCADAHCVFHVSRHGIQLATPKLVRVFRLATGEVARVYKP